VKLTELFDTHNDEFREALRDVDWREVAELLDENPKRNAHVIAMLLEDQLTSMAASVEADQASAVDPDEGAREAHDRFRYGQ
jgi:hypothetical protein